MKTTKIAFTPVLPLLAAIAACFVSLGHAREGNELKFEEYRDPVIVKSLYLDVNGRGSIDIAILFDDQGNAHDWLPLRTNDKTFVRAVGRAIEHWRIEPPQYEGEQSWCYTELSIEFRQSGAVVSITAAEAVMSFFKTMRDDIRMVVPFSELDRIPKPIEMDTPAVHTSLGERNRGRTVRFEFFIDQDGNVRMPIVKDSETENIVTAIILESLLNWKFEPPTRHGVPVSTKAIVPFKVK